MLFDKVIERIAYDNGRSDEDLAQDLRLIGASLEAKDYVGNELLRRLSDAAAAQSVAIARLLDERCRNGGLK